MPGKRNLARERAAHQLTAAETQLHHYHLLSQHYPDRALIGQQSILSFLHDLGIRRLNGRQLTWRILLAWRTKHACPLLRASWHPKAKTPAFSTSHALTSWCLARFATGHLFNVANTLEVSTSGSFPASEAKNAA